MSGSRREALDAVLVPARIINEHIYCPRLAWFEWEAKAFADSADTVEGRFQHRSVDKERGGIRPGARTRDLKSNEMTSLVLESERLGVVAKLDRVRIEGNAAVPIETKHGKPRNGPDEPVWPSDQAQLTVQAILLRESGYQCDFAEVYFPETRTRHQVGLIADAEAWVRKTVSEIRENAGRSEPPPPLVESPKCPRCSLVGVCLPDEANVLAGRQKKGPRRLIAVDTPAKPLYAVTPGSLVRKRGERLVVIHDDSELGSCRLIDVSHVSLFGNANMTSGAMRACLDRDIPVMWFSSSGWYSGHAVPHGGSWVQRRIRQLTWLNAGRSELARQFVRGKILNQRTLLRRNGGQVVEEAIVQLKSLERRVSVATEID